MWSLYSCHLKTKQYYAEKEYPKAISEVGCKIYNNVLD